MHTRTTWMGRWGWGAVGVALGVFGGSLSAQATDRAVASAERARAAEMASRDRAVERARTTRTPAPDLPWIQEDPANRIYLSAREALNQRRFEEAAGQFAEIRSRYPRSGYVADSYYWEAFARSRVGGQPALRRAVELLETQAQAHPSAATRSDADALRVRIEAQLAQRGDAQAAQTIAREASQPCGPQHEVRLAALSALVNMNADQALPILREVLRSREECSVELRRRAVFLVAQKMTPETVEILLDLAHRDPDPDHEVREQAVFWLHQVRTSEALEALEAILAESDDREIQERAIFAISQRQGDPEAGRVLRAFAERRDVPTDLRANAIFWIGQSGGNAAATYLMDLYGQLDDQELRERAIFAISQSDAPAARDWLVQRALDRGESIENRKNALFWAGQVGALNGEQLSTMYETVDDLEMKKQLIFVSSQRSSADGVDFLMRVAREEEDPDLRQSAIFWLGQSNDPRVPEFLLQLIRG